MIENKHKNIFLESHTSVHELKKDYIIGMIQNTEDIDVFNSAWMNNETDVIFTLRTCCIWWSNKEAA